MTRRITVLATGGTIAAERGTDGGLAPALDTDRLLDGIAAPDAEITARQILSVDSAAMTPADTASIARHTAEAARSGTDGVVILHGTDTMEETALTVDLALAADGITVPVILTGAQRSADHPEPDGPANLRLALRSAVHAPGAQRTIAEASTHESRRSAPDEAGTDLGTVRIAFAGRVLPVWGTRKTHTSALDAFRPWPDPTAAADQRTRALDVLRRCRDERLDAGRLVRDERVDTAAVYPGADATAITAFRDAGAQGLVLDALGAGNANPAVVDGVRAAAADGVAVVVTTRVAGGRAFADYGGGGGGTDLAAAGAVVSPVLRAGQARVLLAALLAEGADREAVAAAFGG